MGDGTFLSEWSDADCLLLLGPSEVNCKKLKSSTEIVRLRGFFVFN